MKIDKLTPRGFCKGVINAIYLINNALEDENLKRPIYMLGSIVHNKKVVEAYRNRGIIILDGPSREEMLEKVNEGTVIFTAHGVSDRVRQLAKDKGLDIIDATCKDVLKTHNLIKQKISEGYKILFFGTINHPETEGILGISDEIILITNNTNLSALPKYDGKLIITNQTTMSYLDVINIYEKLKQIYPQLELADELCNATRKRQEAVMDANGYDLIIVVGDKLSNNTKMLLNLASKKAKAIQVETINDLKDFDLSSYNKIAITAGASTPKSIVDEIVFNLEHNTNKYMSNLVLDDYLKG